MKKLKKQIQILLLLCLLFICSACASEDYDDVTYYRTVGIGYVFMYDTLGNLQPVKGAEIEVTTVLKGVGGIFSEPLPKETFTTDETGKYQVRFIKRTQLKDATRYHFTIRYTPVGEFVGWLKYLDFYPEDIINAKNNILTLDTIKLYN